MHVGCTPSSIHQSLQVVTQALAFNESQRAMSNKAQGQAHKAKYKSVLEASKAKMSDVCAAPCHRQCMCAIAMH